MLISLFALEDEDNDTPFHAKAWSGKKESRVYVSMKFKGDKLDLGFLSASNNLLKPRCTSNSWMADEINAAITSFNNISFESTPVLSEIEQATYAGFGA